MAKSLYCIRALTTMLVTVLLLVLRMNDSFIITSKNKKIFGMRADELLCRQKCVRSHKSAE
jgi:hypothetical protein